MLKLAAPVLALPSEVAEDQKPDGVRAPVISKDEYKRMLLDMIEKRDALNAAIYGLSMALSSGAITDPPQSAEAAPELPRVEVGW